MWSQSEFNFLRLQIYITEYTFVYVLRHACELFGAELRPSELLRVRENMHEHITPVLEDLNCIYLN
jgi:hypothetical protein